MKSIVTCTMSLRCFSKMANPSLSRSLSGSKTSLSHKPWGTFPSSNQAKSSPFSLNLVSSKSASVDHTNNSAMPQAAARRFHSIKAETSRQSCSVKSPKTSGLRLMSSSNTDSQTRWSISVPHDQVKGDRYNLRGGVFLKSIRTWPVFLTGLADFVVAIPHIQTGHTVDA